MLEPQHHLDAIGSTDAGTAWATQWGVQHARDASDAVDSPN